MRRMLTRAATVTAIAAAACTGVISTTGIAAAGSVAAYGQPDVPQGGKVTITSTGQSINVVITGRKDALTGSRSCDVSVSNMPAKKVSLDANGNGRVTFGSLKNGQYPVWGYCSSKAQGRASLVGPNAQGGRAAGVTVDGRGAARPNQCVEIAIAVSNAIGLRGAERAFVLQAARDYCPL